MSTVCETTRKRYKAKGQRLAVTLVEGRTRRLTALKFRQQQLEGAHDWLAEMCALGDLPRAAQPYVKDAAVALAKAYVRVEWHLNEMDAAPVERHHPSKQFAAVLKAVA